MQAITDDLVAEHAALDRVVAGLSDEGWRTATPAAGWDVRDCVSHLWFFDVRALMALDPATVDDFRRDAEQLLASMVGGVGPDVREGRAISPAELLARWRADRERLVAQARITDPSARIPWYGPAMAARSFITARVMETWAHGQDVRDALGVAPEVSDRLRHVAHIGVRARAFAYANNGREMPAGDVRVELRGPGGDVWTWGDEAATDAIRGEAIDFCLMVTQRRHVADTGLQVSGALAEEWVSIAQAFAGPPGPGRKAGQFPRR